MLKIAKLALVATNIEAMVTFYNAVLEADLKPVNEVMYEGRVAGIPFVLASNAVVGIEAQQNRQQFDFMVDNIEKTMTLAIESGGCILDPVTEKQEMWIGSVYDPDGNSIVFVQQK